MIVGVLGQKGMGKTTLLKALVARADRALVVDPLGKLGHLGVAVVDVEEFKAYWRRQAERQWRIVLQPAAIDNSRPPKDVLEPFLAVAMKAARQGALPFWVLVDEVDAFGTAWAADPRIRAFADYGRNFGVSLVYTVRRPACVDRTLTSQSDVLYLFRATEPRDLEYCASVIGKAAAGYLPGLHRFHALRWCGAGKDISIVNVSPNGGGGENASPPAEIENPLTGAGDAVDAPSAGPALPLDPTECVVLTLKELAARFGFADPRKFKVVELDSGRLPFRRVSFCRWMVPKRLLPSDN